jgi:hypothetical protein
MAKKENQKNNNVKKQQTESNIFFDHPVLNSPYECPARHWELDKQGQPTQKIIDARRRADFITPIPKPKKRKKKSKQEEFVFDEGKGLSTKEQQYDPTSIINEVRGHVDTWRSLPNQNQWQVTPETARLLQHWRHHNFNDFRPSFKLVIPHISVVEAFAELIQLIFSFCKRYEDESGILTSIRDTLLPKLLSGEVRVKDAERFVGEAV